MRIRPIVALALCLATASCQHLERLTGTETPSSPFQTPADDVPELIVRFRTDVGRMPTTLRDYPGIAHQRDLLLPRTHLYNVRPGVSAQEALSWLQQDPRVEFAQANTRVTGTFSVERRGAGIDAEDLPGNARPSRPGEK